VTGKLPARKASWCAGRQPAENESEVCPDSQEGQRHCPGLGQDMVNFHWNPGRGTFGWADSTWPHRAGYSIPCAVMLGSGGGELGSRNSLAARERAAPLMEGGSVGCVVCVVFSPYLWRNG